MSTDVSHLFKGLFHFYETEYSLVKYLGKLAPHALKDCSFVLQQCFLPSKPGGHVLHPLVTSWVTVGSRVPASAAGEEAGNARHSRAALYPMGDNGRRAERQGCAPGHVPHCLDRKQPFLSSFCVPALVIVLMQSTHSTVFAANPH